MTSRLASLPIALLALVLLAQAPPARAWQDPVPPVEPDEADADALRPTEGDLDGSFLMTETQFNVWAFGTTASLPTIRARFENRVARQLEELGRTFALSEPQKQKLKLAAAGDVNWLFHQVEDRLRRYADKRFDAPAIDAIQRDLKQVHDAFDAGLMNPGCLVQKALRTTLSQGQTSAYESVQQQRKVQRFRERLDSFLMVMLANLRLSREQAETLSPVVLRQVPVARQAEVADSATDFGPAVYQALATLPAAEMAGLLSPKQLEQLHEILRDEGHTVPAAAPERPEPAAPKENR